MDSDKHFEKSIYAPFSGPLFFFFFFRILLPRKSLFFSRLKDTHQTLYNTKFCVQRSSASSVIC